MAKKEKINLEKIAREDYVTKSNLREKEINYYQTKIQEFGLKTIDRFVKYCPDPSKYMELGITFAHRDLEMIAECIADEKPWAVVSGLNPSGPLHFGHKAIFDELLWMQNHGADVFIPLTNDESYVVGKTKSIAESRKISYEQIIPSIIAMGFDPKKTHIFVDSDYLDIYNVAMDISTKVTLNKIFKVFGFTETKEGENPGTMFYRSAVQLAQILLPQYPEFGGPKPTLIPIGIDQHPYVLLARDIAEKKNFIPPAELVMKFLCGFDGKGKMSASREGSSIFLIDSTEKAKKILESSYTGGSPVANFQREYGGVPEICPIRSIRMYHFLANDDISHACTAGKILCEEDKKLAIKEVTQYLEEHQSKLLEAKKRIGDFLLKTKIKSIL